MGETRIDRDVRILKSQVAEMATGGIDMTAINKKINDAIAEAVAKIEVPETEVPEADFGPIEEKITNLNTKLNDITNTYAGKMVEINGKLEELFEHPSIKTIKEELPVVVVDEVVEEVIEEVPPEDAPVEETTEEAPAEEP